MTVVETEDTLHGIEKTFFVDKWDFDNCFPVLLLPVEIEVKVGGIEIDDRRTWFSHEILNVRLEYEEGEYSEGFWEELSTS